MLLFLAMFLVFLIAPRLVLIITVSWFLSKAFLHVMRSSRGYFFQFFYMVDCMYWILSVEPSLYLWEEIFFILVNTSLDVVLDLVWNYSIACFCICVHRGNRFVISLLFWVIVWCEYQGNCGPLECIVNCFLYFILWNHLRSTDVSSSLTFW